MKMTFHPSDPFPLPDTGTSYAEAKAHAEKVDEWLGFEMNRVENRVAPTEQQNWQGLPVQSLLTPYCEIREMFSLLDLKDGQSVVDLGCAYGRMAFVIQRHYPLVSFTGYEIEALRVQEGARVLESFRRKSGVDESLLKPQILCQDLTDPAFQLPEADVYFIYDFGHSAAVDRILQELKDRARHRPFRLIGRGRLTRSRIHQDHAWLAEVNEPVHRDTFSIYQS